MTSTGRIEERVLYRRAQDAFGERVHAVRDDQWSAATPCPGWDVRSLVNHLVYELRWAVPLLAGRTIAEVGDRFEGDLLGDDPAGRWDRAADEAVAAVDGEGAMDRTVHLSFGDFPGREYALQLFADLLIHGWDLSVATGQDTRLDPDLVAACAAWFAGVADGYRQAGAVAARPDVPDDADPQTRLLADFGRSVPAH
jgi:uncharacterized protein (TIGR03086 family)